MADRRGNLVALAASRAVIVGSGLVVNVLLARWMTREDFGTYQLIWGVCAVSAVGGNLGLWQLLTRRVAQDPELASTLLPVALRGALLTSLVTALAVVGIVAGLDPRPEVLLAAFFGALTMASNAAAQLVQATFHGLRRMFVEFGPVVAGRLVFLVAQVGLAAAGFGIAALYMGRWIAALVALAGLLWSWRRIVGGAATAVPAGSVSAWLREGRVYGPAVLFGAIAAQADVVMLGALADPVEVARYKAPASVLLQLAFVATLLSRTFFPTVSRLVVDDPAAVAGELTLQVRLQLLVAVPLAVGGFVVAPDLVTTLFGPAYADAALPMQALCVAVPLRFLNNAYGLTLTALDAQGDRARIDFFGAALNVGLNLWAIPRYGAEGAAITTVVTEALTHLMLRRRIGRDVRGAFELGPLARTLLPAMGMAMGVWAMDGTSLWLRVAAGGVGYMLLAGLTGGLRRDDLARLVRI